MESNSVDGHLVCELGQIEQTENSAPPFGVARRLIEWSVREYIRAVTCLVVDFRRSEQCHVSRLWNVKRWNKWEWIRGDFLGGESRCVVIWSSKYSEFWKTRQKQFQSFIDRWSTSNFHGSFVVHSDWGTIRALWVRNIRRMNHLQRELAGNEKPMSPTGNDAQYKYFWSSHLLISDIL